MMETSQDFDRPALSPSDIAKYYSLNQCKAYLAHEYGGADIGAESIDDVALSPLLEAVGEEHEQEQIEALLQARVTAIGPSDSPLADSFDEHWSEETSANIDRIRTLVDNTRDVEDGKPLVLYQAPVRAQVKAWPVTGNVDVILVVPTEYGVSVKVVEIKSSSETLTHHKLQAATYTLALKSLLRGYNGVEIEASVTSMDTTVASVITATGDIDLDDLPTVDLRPVETDIKLRLEAGGPVDEILLNGSELPNHQLNTKCEGCPHQARCLGHDIVHKDLALLQLPESTQITFAEHGVTSVSDVAELYEIPTNKYDRSPVNHDALEPAKPELVETLQEKTEVSNLSELAQIAHRFRRELEPDFNEQWQEKTEDGPWPMALVGSGANLPDDNPNDENWDGEWDRYPKRSLVRVYPTVVHDYVRDRLVYLGAVVTSTRYENGGNTPEYVIARPQDLPTETDAKDDEERRLLKQFFEQLSTAISKVAPKIAEEDESCGQEDGYIHLYPWSERQRDNLIAAVKRHPDATGSPAIRKLLGLRKEIDQEAVSILTEEFRERHALRYPGLGLVQTVAQFYWGDGDFSWNDTWDADRDSIKEVFSEGLFKSAVSVDKLAGDRLLPHFEDGYTIPDDDYRQDVYPVLERHRDTVPLEYIWGCEELDRLNPTSVSDPKLQERINQYRYYQGTDSPRISLDDIDRLVMAICSAIHYVERAIGYKDAFTKKEPIKVHELQDEQFGETALQRACVEYQQLDFGAEKEKLVRRYRKSLQQRVMDGDAVAFECSRTPESNEATIRGDTVHDLGSGMNGGAEAPLSLSSGDWVVVTPLEWDDGRLVERPDRPEDYMNSTLAVVERVSKDSVKLFSMWDDGDWPHSKDPNMTWHYGWTPDQEEARTADHFTSQSGRKYDKTLIERGKYYVIDEAVDDYSAYRSRCALDNASENVVHNRLVSVYEDNDPSALRESTFDDTRINEFLQIYDRVMPEQTNNEQKEFVQEAGHTITALQGPPGTGKTSMASTPAMLARAYAHQAGFNGLCTAHSNTAVDEYVDDVADACRRLNAEGTLEDMTLIRVRSSSSYRETPPNVDDLHYRDDKEQLLELFDESFHDDSRVLFFGTPVTIRNALNQAVREKSDEHDSIEKFMEVGKSRLFHAALVDEASMMDLPVLFLVGAFLRADGQLMLVGDHRQMQPIQSHDWEEEDRQPIEEHTPALSVLDFVRFIRGDVGADLSHLERDPPEWPDPDAVLPMKQLTVTYRLPQSVADLETQLFYSRDNIALESGVDNDTIPDVRDTAKSEWLEAALDPAPRVTLIIHDENQSQQESPFEAELTRQIVDSLPTADPSENSSPQRVTAGVVVPFRLQRRRLRQTLAPHVQVDTVEKFQGGERDLIVLSMTAGSQGYVNSLTEFMLDPNRFNVGASRMRKKLVIIASKAIFRAGSTDASEYAEQKSWKLLYEEMVNGKQPTAQGTIHKADVPELNSKEVSVKVYNGFEDKS